MRYSVAFASEVDSWKWVKRAESLGFHAAWFYDTQLLNPDVFVCMARLLGIPSVCSSIS